MAGRYRVFGLSVESDFDLPAPPATGATSVPDVIIRAGEVPSHLPDAVDIMPRYQTAPDRLLLDIEGAGRYFVQDGREIVVQPEPGATARDVQPFLIGSAFAALLQQRGNVTLHASSIRAGDAAVAFAGMKGAGKSTIAAAFAQRGYEVMTDDLCPLRVDGDTAMVSAGFRRIKLHHDSARALGVRARDDAGASGGDKLELSSLPPGEGQEWLPLRRLYVLGGRPASSGAPTIDPLEGPVRLPLLKEHTFRFRFLKGFGRTAQHFQQCVALLRSLEIYHVRRPADLNGLPVLIDSLERHLSAARRSQ